MEIQTHPGYCADSRYDSIVPSNCATWCSSSWFPMPPILACRQAGPFSLLRGWQRFCSHRSLRGL